jgi:holo-ACP synthase
MSFGKFVNSLLAARDRRQEVLSGALGNRSAATVVLSLNIPGPVKSPPGSRAVFSWAAGRLLETFPQLRCYCDEADLLGFYAIFFTRLDPLAAKRACVAVEESHPAARLIDLDVYSANGVQIGRNDLALPPRNCLVCSNPAVECMRLKRHPYDEVIGKAHGLLTSFRT